MQFKKNLIAKALTVTSASLLTVGAAEAILYEVWASDQSNSVTSATGAGSRGGLAWIYSSGTIETLVAFNTPPMPIGCPVVDYSGNFFTGYDGGLTGNDSSAETLSAPCLMQNVFSDELEEFKFDQGGAGGIVSTGKTLGSPDGGKTGLMGRLHGMIGDPLNRYMNMNFFSPNGGWVGIVDADSKKSVALYRVTQTNAGQSLHMSFWNSDGSKLLLANLHGRILERIDINRDVNGNIISTAFNLAASVGVGATAIVESARAYKPNNAIIATGPKTDFVTDIIGLTGPAVAVGVNAEGYSVDATAQLTQNGICKQNDCAAGPATAALGGRNANVIVCPIVSSNGMVYITFGGGGLLVADSNPNPGAAFGTDLAAMPIVGEFDKQVINGAGCGGVEAGGNVYLNAGASAAGGGSSQSEETMYRLSTAFNTDGTTLPPNFPSPKTLFKAILGGDAHNPTSATNTATGGATTGDAINTSGQVPGTTTRRDAHGATGTVTSHYIHHVDRGQNTARSFNVRSGAHIGYSLIADASGNLTSACSDVAITDDAANFGTGSTVLRNDPTPDLMSLSPNNDFLFFASRGPSPVSVQHVAQGTCPGFGIIELSDDGETGELVKVVRTTNTLNDTTAPTITAAKPQGSTPYTGKERSDVHGVTTRLVNQSN